MNLPNFSIIKQIIDSDKLGNDLLTQLEYEIAKVDLMNNLKPNDVVGITVGSRKIDQLHFILIYLGNIIRQAGGIPLILPAMGSHGGTTIDGQLSILESLGITEESTGISISRQAESSVIGTSKYNMPVYCNNAMCDIDKVIVINKIKHHTDFTGAIESGLCKMLAVGLGGVRGAQTIHSYALYEGYETVIKDAAECIVSYFPVVCGLGILENSRNEISEIKAIQANAIYEEEKNLLIKHKRNSIRLPFDNVDILIIHDMGKNISGTGMDTKIIGRLYLFNDNKLCTPCIKRLVVNNLTVESHGNATGVGHADFITKKLYVDIDFKHTFINSISSMTPEQGKIPCVCDTEKDAYEAATKTLGCIRQDNIKISYILNTSKLEYLIISNNMINDNVTIGNFHFIKSLNIEYDSCCNLRFYHELSKYYEC